MAGRRGFLKGMAFVAGSFLAAVATLPVVGAVLTPLLDRRKKEDGGFLPAGTVDELLPGVPKRVDLTSVVIDGWTRSVGVVGSAWLLKSADGTVSALSTICPHSGCSINFGGKETFGCPCHASSFALDGKPLSGPSPRPLDPLRVEVREGKVFVRYARFKQGTPKREEV